MVNWASAAGALLAVHVCTVAAVQHSLLLCVACKHVQHSLHPLNAHSLPFECKRNENYARV
jgi:hypothetical protein